MNTSDLRTSESTPRRPFEAVMVALSAAMLVILGIALGRFLVDGETSQVADQVEVEVSTLRAELAELKRELIRSQSDLATVQESSAQYQKLASHHQSRADKLQAQQILLDQTLTSLVQERGTCLGELQQYAAIDQSLSANDVLRFAQDMFDAQVQMLQRIAGDDEASIPTYPRLHASRSHETSIIGAQRSGAQIVPQLPAPIGATRPHMKTASSASPTTARQGVYFAPPQRSQPRQRASYTFFTPDRPSQVAAAPRSSGITFHETADAGSGDSIRR